MLIGKVWFWYCDNIWMMGLQRLCIVVTTSKDHFNQGHNKWHFFKQIHLGLMVQQENAVCSLCGENKSFIDEMMRSHRLLTFATFQKSPNSDAPRTHPQIYCSLPSQTPPIVWEEAGDWLSLNAVPSSLRAPIHLFTWALDSASY